MARVKTYSEKIAEEERLIITESQMIHNLRAENAKLKRKLKKCRCPNCGYDFEVRD